MDREAVEAVLATGPVCDGCLGRCFADRDDDRSSEARGEALRATVAAPPLDDSADCWVCAGRSPDVDVWTERVLEAVEDIAVETIQVGTRVPDQIEENEVELRESAGLDADAGESINVECNRGVGRQLETRLDATVDFEYPDVVTILDLDSESVELQLNPAYLGGRYRKIEPGLESRSRICRVCNGEGTEWREGQSMPCAACDGSGYDTRASVEWHIAEAICEAMDGSAAIFNAAGGEGPDVLVLGEGRPFVVEVKDARSRPPDTAAISDAIHTASDGALTIEGLEPAHRDFVEHLTQTPIRETYRFEVTFDEAVSPAVFADAIETLADASIHQRLTRGDRVTDEFRKLGHVSGELTDDTSATIEVHATKGVDLEAVLVGDSDRSDPNLAALVDTEVHVASTAVVAVEGRDDPLDLARYRRDRE